MRERPAALQEAVVRTYTAASEDRPVDQRPAREPKEPSRPSEGNVPKGFASSKRLLSFLAEADQILASSLDYSATLADLARLTVPRLADWCAVDLAGGEGPPHRLAVAHSDPERGAWAEEMSRRYPPYGNARHPVARVIETGRSLLLPDITEGQLEAAATDAVHLSLLRDLGLKSVICVPMSARGRTLGVITLVAAESGRTYDASDLLVAEDIARRAAMAMDNARLYRAAQEEIAERQRAETRVRATFERAQQAVAESHDQAKSELESIVALVDVHLAGEGDPAGREELRRLRAGLVTLAALREVLKKNGVESGQARFISAKTLVEELLPAIPDAADRGRLRLQAEDVRITVRQSSTLALIASELVSYALSQSDAEVHLELSEEYDSIVLEVSDDGLGLAGAFKTPPAASCLRSVEALCRRDLGGQMSYEKAPRRASVRVTLPLEADRGPVERAEPNGKPPMLSLEGGHRNGS